MFETSIDLSFYKSVTALSHCFEIIEAVSPDFFILSSTAVFDLFFSSSSSNTIIDSEENEILQRKVESYCRRKRNLILRLDLSGDDDVDVNDLLDRCEFLDIPHLFVGLVDHGKNSKTSCCHRLQSFISVLRSRSTSTKISFAFSADHETMKAYTENISKDRNLSKIVSLWFEHEQNENAQKLLPFFLSEDCFGISISKNSSVTNNHDLRLLSEFAARGCIFNLKFPTSTVDSDLPFLDFDLVQESVTFLSLLIKSIIEDIGCSIQRKATLHHASIRNRNGDKKTNDFHNNSNKEEKSIARDLALSNDANDRLQHPLQPLREDLSRSTYAEFENDDVKYEKYQEAIDLAILDLKHHQQQEQEKISENDENNENDDDDDRKKEAPLAIVVLGAGSRGPLVSCVLKSLEKFSRVNFCGQQQRQTLSANNDDDHDNNTRTSSCHRVFAIEKNKFAYEMLKRKQNLMVTKNDYKLIFGDGRDDENVGKQIIDDLLSHNNNNNNNNSEKNEEQRQKWNLLLVSELLGSFGDNELSPECIEGFLVALNKSSQNSLVSFERVTCIPQKYTSYISLARVAPKILNQLVINVDNNNNNNNNNNRMKHQPYVVKATRIWTKSWKPANASNNNIVAPVFTFDHSFSDNEDDLSQIVDKIVKNSKNMTTLRKEINFISACTDDEIEINFNGIMGYFDCVLYRHHHHHRKQDNSNDTVSFSIIPSIDEHTPDMYSWFPIFFPLDCDIDEKEKAVENDRKGSNRLIIKLIFERKKEENKRVWYEWEVVGQSKKMNKDGKDFSIML